MPLEWLAPHPLAIANVDFEKVDGDKMITLMLSDNTQLKIVYCDETSYVKKWKVGEKVLLSIELSAKNIAFNPFLIISYTTQYTYGISHINSVTPFAG